MYKPIYTSVETEPKMPEGWMRRGGYACPYYTKGDFAVEYALYSGEWAGFCSCKNCIANPWRKQWTSGMPDPLACAIALEMLHG